MRNAQCRYRSSLTLGRCRRYGAACARVRQLRSIRELRASRPRLQGSGKCSGGGSPVMAQQMKSDWLLFGTTVAMVGFGLVMIYSASSVVAELNPHLNSSFYYAGHQLVWAAVSFVALMYFKRRDYRVLQSAGWAFGSLGMVLFLQILVFFLDSKTHRWFRLQGVGTLQPSEFAKPALIIFFAYFVTQKREAINTRR